MSSVYTTHTVTVWLCSVVLCHVPPQQKLGWKGSALKSKLFYDLVKILYCKLAIFFPQPRFVVQSLTQYFDPNNN